MTITIRIAIFFLLKNKSSWSCVLDDRIYNAIGDYRNDCIFGIWCTHCLRFRTRYIRRGFCWLYHCFRWRDEKYKYMAAAVWNGENQLLLRVNILDYCIGNLGISFGFRDDFISLTAKKCAEGFLHDYDGVAGGRRKSF